MFEDTVLERDQEGHESSEGPPSAPAAHEPNVTSERPEVTARAPAQERPASKQPTPPETVSPEVTPQRRGFLRRRPVVSAIGAVLLAATLGGGTLYMNYTEHFDSTDDAFIAARQFALAPKISGYITAVPVTDNQHVAAGDVIARIDDRDYRVALAQAEDQVAAAQASIHNVDAHIDVQQEQLS